MDCTDFQARIYRFQADELSAVERQACQEHLDGCERCAGRLRAEEAMLGLLRKHLRRTSAPAGLESRIRKALGREARTPLGPPWYRTHWFAATAAALLLMAVLIPGVTGGFGRLASPERVTAEVTVVDRDCDAAGASMARQRRCNHPLHVNALKLADGRYWAISPDPLQYRPLLLSADQRGRRLRISGEYHRRLRTVRLARVEPLDAGL